MVKKEAMESGMVGMLQDVMENDPIPGRSGVFKVQEAKDQGFKMMMKAISFTKLETSFRLNMKLRQTWVRERLGKW